MYNTCTKEGNDVVPVAPVAPAIQWPGVYTSHQKLLPHTRPSACQAVQWRSLWIQHMHPISLSLGLIIIFSLVFLFIFFRFIWCDPTYRSAIMPFLSKTKAFFERKFTPEQDEPESSREQEQRPPPQHGVIYPPTVADVMRYRYHHGTNLGSVFILERWLTPSMFHDSAKGSSELTAVETWIKNESIDQARERFERHWRDYVSDQDLDWLRDVARCTTVRLPIGYFTLGPRFCEKTDFKDVATVYTNAWDAVRQLVKRCCDRGIGVLVDLHGLPGSTNGQDHSGTDSKKAEFWTTRRHRELATRCVCYVAEQAREMQGVVGIQIVNESPWDPPGMYEWYEQVLIELGRIDSSMPVYVSDGWDLGRARGWSQWWNSTHVFQRCPLVVDTHLYWCFTDEDKQKSPQQITGEVWGKLSELDGKDGNVSTHGAAQAIVGEYSCALDGQTLANNHAASKESAVQAFGQAQSGRFQHRAGGSFFWTYRMDWMPGGEWGFRQMNEQHAIVAPVHLTLSADDVHNRVDRAKAQKDQRKHGTVSGHCQYWDSNHPGHYEHWRFENGWEVGFEDASAFFEMRSKSQFVGGDKIGMLDLWVLKRLRDSGTQGQFAWEYEHGLRQGVRDFCECVDL